MSAAIRKKRNFKGLGLDVSAPPPAPAPEPALVPLRAAPAAGAGAGTGSAPTLAAAAPAAKKRPPPMQLKAPKIPSGNGVAGGAAPIITQAVENPTLLTVDDAPTSAPATAGASPNVNAKRMTYHTELSHTLANLDLAKVHHFEIKNNDDVRELNELGQGNGGSVKKVEHIPTGTLMAKKVRLCEGNVGGFFLLC